MYFVCVGTTAALGLVHIICNDVLFWRNLQVKRPKIFVGDLLCMTRTEAALALLFIIPVVPVRSA